MEEKPLDGCVKRGLRPVKTYQDTHARKKKLRWWVGSSHESEASLHFASSF